MAIAVDKKKKTPQEKEQNTAGKIYAQLHVTNPFWAESSEVYQSRYEKFCIQIISKNYSLHAIYVPDYMNSSKKGKKMKQFFMKIPTGNSWQFIENADKSISYAWH